MGYGICSQTAGQQLSVSFTIKDTGIAWTSELVTFKSALHTRFFQSPVTHSPVRAPQGHPLREGLVGWEWAWGSVCMCVCVRPVGCNFIRFLSGSDEDNREKESGVGLSSRMMAQVSGAKALPRGPGRESSVLLV